MCTVTVYGILSLWSVNQTKVDFIEIEHYELGSINVKNLVDFNKIYRVFNFYITEVIKHRRKYK